MLVNKRNGYTFRGDNSCQNCFASLQKSGLLNRERSCSEGEQLLPFRVDPCSEGIGVEQSGNHKVVFLSKIQTFKTKQKKIDCADKQATTIFTFTACICIFSPVTAHFYPKFQTSKLLTLHVPTFQ